MNKMNNRMPWFISTTKSYLTIINIDYYNEIPIFPALVLSNTIQANIVIQRVQEHLPVLMVLENLLLRMSKPLIIPEKITSMGCYETSKNTSVKGLSMTKITSKGGWSKSKVPSLGGLYVKLEQPSVILSYFLV